MASLAYYEIVLAIVFFLFCSLLATSNNNGLPRNWPLLGMLPTVLLQFHRIHDWATGLFRQTDGTFLFKGPSFSNMDMLTTVDPSNIHYIMSANFSNFPKGPQFLKIFDILGDGIFNSDGDLWKNQRKFAQMQISNRRFHRFLVKTSHGKLEKGLIPILDSVSKQGLVVDLQDLFQRFTFDTTFKLVTGYDLECLSIQLPDVPFSKAMDDAEETIFLRHAVPETIWKFQRYLGIGQEKKMSKAWETLDHMIYKYISMKKVEISKGIIKSQEEEEEEEEEEEGVDLLTSYLNEDNHEFADDKFLRDTILNFMIAGRDTTSSALTWFVWLVSTHPIVETKIREELAAAHSAGQGFKVEDLTNLVYLHSAICESLRLYPPVPFQHKEPLQPDTLPSGHFVHPKMKILFSVYAMGRMGFIWGEDCLEFKPERWISETGKVKHEPSYKFMAFNAGPRTCLGKEVAFTQMKVVAANIIHNYHFQVVEGHLVEPNVSIILYMKHGLKVRVTKRWC